MKLSIKGTTDLKSKIKSLQTTDATKEVVKRYGAKLQAKAQQNAVFRGHYENNVFVKPTGATRQSIMLHIEDGGATARVTVGTEYAIFLELGTRYMASQPFLKPSFDAVVDGFVVDIKRSITSD